MTIDNLSTAGAPVDGSAAQDPAPAHGGLWKVGIAAAVVAAAVLVFVSGWWLGAKRDGRKEGGSHGKVQLWEDGPYWAETNIGAENPEDCGYYFWWGDTVGYKREGNALVASDGSSRNFESGGENPPTVHKSINNLRSEGWITEDGVLAPKHDAAHVHWGGGLAYADGKGTGRSQQKM